MQAQRACPSEARNQGETVISLMLLSLRVVIRLLDRQVFLLDPSGGIPPSSLSLFLRRARLSPGSRCKPETIRLAVRLN